MLASALFVPLPIFELFVRCCIFLSFVISPPKIILSFLFVSES